MYYYDSLGRQVTIIQPSANGNRLATENYFDNAGNLVTKIQVPVDAKKLQPVGEKRVVKYAHNAIGQVTIDYNNFGERKTLNRFANGKEVVKTDYNWDTLGRVTEIKHGNVNTFAYTWDNANRITKVDSTNDKAKYEYDKTSQLINAKYEKRPSEQYQYDLNGNRKTNKTGEYNRLLSDSENSYQYDNEGNRIAKISSNGITKYSWDSRNRLVKVETPNETVEYVYDYQNRLVKRTQDNNVTVFVHDNYQVVLQLENNKPTHQYLWGTNQDELLCDNDNWALGDHLNSVRDVVIANGSITHFEYDAFGKLLSKNTDNTVFAYTGKMRDSVSDLQWNINRWYDANVGRWCSDDPIGFEAKDINLYRYIQNRVTFSFDPTGRFLITCHCSGWLSTKDVDVASSWCGGRFASNCCSDACSANGYSGCSGFDVKGTVSDEVSIFSEALGAAGDVVSCVNKIEVWIARALADTVGISAVVGQKMYEFSTVTNTGQAYSGSARVSRISVTAIAAYEAGDEATFKALMAERNAVQSIRHYLIGKGLPSKLANGLSVGLRVSGKIVTVAAVVESALYVYCCKEVLNK